jgi:hypothetical protein
MLIQRLKWEKQKHRGERTLFVGGYSVDWQNLIVDPSLYSRLAHPPTTLLKRAGALINQSTYSEDSAARSIIFQ